MKETSEVRYEIYGVSKFLLDKHLIHRISLNIRKQSKQSLPFLNLLSRALAGNPQLKTIEKIAKALDVSIKSLFDDPNDVEGFILLRGQSYHFNSNAELLSIQERTKQGIKVSLG